MFFQYETPRLLLKVLRADCAPQVLDFYNRDKELFEMYEIDRVPDFYTVKHLQKVLRYEYNMAVKSQLFRFYVFQKENPCRIIGTVCIHNIAPAFYGSCEIGYKFSSEFHHMGYATEAVGFCTKLAFNELRMHKVTAVVHPGNVPSMIGLASCRRGYCMIILYYMGSGVITIFTGLLINEPIYNLT